jgi:putative flippase GtrA
MKRIIAFFSVGVIGFVVDAGCLSLLISQAGLDPLPARCLSFPPAVFVTWALNRLLVFVSTANTMKRRVQEYGRYFLIQLIGVLINFGIFSLLISGNFVFRSYPVVALAVASLVAMVWNFLGARFLVFGHATGSGVPGEPDSATDIDTKRPRM